MIYNSSYTHSQLVENFFKCLNMDAYFSEKRTKIAFAELQEKINPYSMAFIMIDFLDPLICHLSK